MLYHGELCSCLFNRLFGKKGKWIYTEKKMFATRIDPEIFKQLKHLAVDTDRPISDLTEEAIRDLLKKFAPKQKAK